MKSFETGEARSILKMFNLYVQSKLESCSLILNSKDLDKIERIQNFIQAKLEVSNKWTHETRKIRAVAIATELKFLNKCLATTKNIKEDVKPCNRKKWEDEMYKVRNDTNYLRQIQNFNTTLLDRWKD